MARHGHKDFMGMAELTSMENSVGVVVEMKFSEIESEH